MEPQFNVTISSLPPETRALFDAAHPLPPDVQFERRVADQSTFIVNLLIFGVIVGGAFGGSGIFGLVTLTVSLLNGSYHAQGLGDVAVYLVVYAVLAGLVVIAWRTFWLPLWDEGLTLREARARVLRRGIFLTPKTMIVRLKTHVCDLIPREAVLAFERSGGRYRTWYVVYRAASGKTAYYELDFPPFAPSHAHSSGIARIREWAGIKEKNS